GDLLFVCANLARRLKVDPEAALRRANDKFERRFHSMEAIADADGLAFSELSLEQQEAMWQRVKQREHGA
ncbi:MAG: nucleoside triphosphate pyrophosphohydrolase, partial [Pseudomonadota bacterium]